MRAGRQSCRHPPGILDSESFNFSVPLRAAKVLGGKLDCRARRWEDSERPRTLHTLRAKTLGGFIFPFDGVKIIILFLKVLIIPWGVVRTSCCPGTSTTGNKLFPAGTFEFLETGKKTQINRTRTLKWSFNLKLPSNRTSHHHDHTAMKREAYLL